MKTSKDLSLKIKLTPSQLSIIPSIARKLNQDPEMLMDQFLISDDFLVLNCHDTFDLLEALKDENAIELARVKRQLKIELAKVLESADLSPHRRKNYLTSSQALELI